MGFNYDKLYFPYKSVRQYQDLLIQNINASIESRKNLLAHAPTGLGKTAAALAPALYQAFNNNLNLFFLTPRHTQHRLVIDTLKEIKDKHGISIPVVDLIAKQSMCPQPLAKELGRTDFLDYCREARKDGKCVYYRNTRKVELTEEAEQVLADLLNNSPMHSEDFCAACADNKMCPYEMALELGKKSRVVVCDYFHLFADHVRNAFMAKMNKDLEESVVIIDEAHNLPDRVRSLMTSRLTTYTINNSIKELESFEFFDEAEVVRYLLRSFEGLVPNKGKESIVAKDDLVKHLTSLSGFSFEEVIELLITAGQAVREERKKSYTLAVARFLADWVVDEPDRVRIIKRERSRRGNEFISLSYCCLNPAQYTEPVFDESYSSILMSGTLTPTSMYSEVLGVSKSSVIELKSPFPKENRLTLIIPETTTRYSKRSDDMYQRIAGKLESLIKSLSVSTAVFFPSYRILNEVSNRLSISDRKIIIEQRGLSKEAKDSLLNSFRDSQGSVLLGVVSGNFGEGIDLPGDELECIIIVGVPLPVPDLYAKSLINYYDERFSKGWDYGYVFPALTRVIQNAGRCIRQSTDKGLIILLDERYAWSNYYKCIPADWDVKITKHPEKMAREFFKHQG
ncbi:DEAD/DEAH box helicase [archaeon]|nr:DEAD/DEAH box helicase [archaeon]